MRARASWGLNEYHAGCRIKATQSASATQRPPALWRQNPSGRDLYGQGRVWESALPLSRRIVDGPENRDWSAPDCGSAAAAVARLSKDAQGALLTDKVYREAL